MRGMKALADMRREGFKPAVAFIDTDAGPVNLPSWGQWQLRDPAHADIDIEASDSLLRIDFRPLLGLTVHVSGVNDARVRAVANLVQEAGAKRVIYSLLEQLGRDEFIAFKTVWIYDTEGQCAPKEAGFGERAA